jgi:glycosyltransferase involved in cell wall biosynthesis
MPTRILFLAAQIQPYLMAGFRSLLQYYDVEILLYAKQSEGNSLLQIPTDGRLRIYWYNDAPDPFFWNEVHNFRPNIVVCAGWMYLRYLDWCKKLKLGGAKTICAMDTQWKGNFKQKLFLLISPFFLHKVFTHAWVPGDRQLRYALRLGFSQDKILNYLYAADTVLFANAFNQFSKIKKSSFPKVFLYVGRLESHKLKNLLLAFRMLTPSERDHWRLLVVGDGSMKDNALLNHPVITVLDAVSQSELIKIIADSGVFCLCSKAEPWGTVVQEFSAAGMPLLISMQCGSSDYFLKSNGIICDGTDVKSIKEGLLKFIAMNDVQLNALAEMSHIVGISSNSNTWSNELMKLA